MELFREIGHDCKRLVFITIANLFGLCVLYPVCCYVDPWISQKILAQVLSLFWVGPLQQSLF